MQRLADGTFASSSNGPSGTTIEAGSDIESSSGTHNWASSGGGSSSESDGSSSSSSFGPNTTAATLIPIPWFGLPRDADAGDPVVDESTPGPKLFQGDPSVHHREDLGRLEGALTRTKTGSALFTWSVPRMETYYVHPGVVARDLPVRPLISGHAEETGGPQWASERDGSEFVRNVEHLRGLGRADADEALLTKPICEPPYNPWSNYLQLVVWPSRISGAAPTIEELSLNVAINVPTGEVQAFAETLRHDYESEQTAALIDARDRRATMPPRTLADANPQISGWLAEVEMTGGNLKLTEDLGRRADSGKTDDGGEEEAKDLESAFQSDPPLVGGAGEDLILPGVPNGAVNNALNDQDPPIFTGIGVLSPEALAEKYKSVGTLLGDIEKDLRAKIDNEDTLRKQARADWLSHPYGTQAEFIARVKILRENPQTQVTQPGDQLIRDFIEHYDKGEVYETQLAAAAGKSYSSSQLASYTRPVTSRDELIAVFVEMYGLTAKALLHMAASEGWQIQVHAGFSQIDAPNKTIFVSQSRMARAVSGHMTAVDADYRFAAGTLRDLLLAQFGAKVERERPTTAQVLENAITMQFFSRTKKDIDHNPWNIVNPASTSNFLFLTVWGTVGVGLDMLPTALIYAPSEARHAIGKAFDRATNDFERGMLAFGYGYTFVAQLGAFAASEMAFQGLGMGFAAATGTRGSVTTARAAQLGEEFRAAGFDFEVVGTRLANAERAAFELKATGYTSEKLTQLESTLETIAGEKVLSQRIVFETERIPPLQSVVLKKATTSGLTELVPTAGKTTTVIGRYNEDMRAILKQLEVEYEYSKATGPIGDIMQKYRRGNKGGFNFLNIADDVHFPGKPDAWWDSVNMQWIDDVAARGDEVIVVSAKRLMKNADGALTTFGREVTRLIEKHRYQWNNDFTRLIPPVP